MNKNNKIHIRIELCKDEDSGNITLMTYFDPNAPNFSQDNKGFYWLPTHEEKDFLNDVFEIFPEFEMKSPHAEKMIKESLEQKKDNPVVTEPPINMERRELEKTMTEPLEKKDLTPPPPQAYMQKNELEKTMTESLEKKEEPITNNPQQVDMQKRETEKTMTELLGKKELTPPPPQAYMQKNEQERPSSPFEKQERQYPIDNIPPFKKTEETNPGTTQQTPNTNEVREEIKDEPRKEFVEADDQDIDRALEKGEDKSMIEADEDTIVERVLSQKQKGKWIRDR